MPKSMELVRAPQFFDPAIRRSHEEIRYLAEQMPGNTVTFASQTSIKTLVAAKREIPRALKMTIELVGHIRRRVQNEREETSRYARIVAVIPTFETEDEIDRAVEKLLLQSRAIDKIVVVVNGPGNSTVAYDKVVPYAKLFSNLVLVRPTGLAGKVNTLNWAFRHHVYGQGFDFILGVDADVESDVDMVANLEEDLLKRNNAAGVMARYSFLIPEDMKGKSRSLIYGQRHEFAMTGIKHQLRHDTSEILGGQATLFRIDALTKAAYQTYGGMPWDPRSKVEDAELTRTLQACGYTTATSRSARAWTGLMENAHSWQKQRRKWQDGHLEDMLRDFHPWHDRRRWFEQIAMGWNLLIRVLFAMLLITSVALNMFTFNPLWLIPVGFAVLQSFLVALRVPNRRLGEITRSLWFVPGETYYVRTLSVWLDSVILAFLNVKRDGWKNQAAAESSTKKTALSGWAIIVMAVAVPTVGFMLAARFLPEAWVSTSITWLWYTLSVMTIVSLVGMFWKVLRILRNFRTLAP